MIINATPHEINVYDEDGKRIIQTISPSGNVIRLRERKIITLNEDGIKIEEVKLEVDELPELLEGVYYIVSMPVAMAIKRNDFIVPHDYVRDENGRIIGCKKFKIITDFEEVRE